MAIYVNVEGLTRCPLRVRLPKPQPNGLPGIILKMRGSAQRVSCDVYSIRRKKKVENRNGKTDMVFIQENKLSVEYMDKVKSQICSRWKVSKIL